MSVYFLENGVTNNSATDALRASIPDIIGITSLEAALKPKADTDNGTMPIVIVPLPPGEREQFDGLVQMLDRHGDNNGPFYILVGDELTATDYKKLLRTGCADWTSFRAGPSEVIEMISRRRTSQTAAHSARRTTVLPLPSLHTECGRGRECDNNRGDRRAY